MSENSSEKPMPASALDLPSYLDVQEHLRATLPKSTLSSVDIRSAKSPLLILCNQNVVSCFAFSDASVRHDYEILYSGFKKYYLEHEREWESADLTFVFC